MVSKSQDVRLKTTLVCSECKECNYITKENRRNTPDRLELVKYCPRCHESTAHRETRRRLPSQSSEDHWFPGVFYTWAGVSIILHI